MNFRTLTTKAGRFAEIVKGRFIRAADALAVYRKLEPSDASRADRLLTNLAYATLDRLDQLEEIVAHLKECARRMLHVRRLSDRMRREKDAERTKREVWQDLVDEQRLDDGEVVDQETVDLADLRLLGLA